MSFADVEAVRVVLPAPGGLEERLEEAWARYGLPLAVTECHNGCTREEQMRWVRDAWDSALRLRGRGVDVRAVTAWSLFGAYDWNALLTRETGHYEPGAFDVSSGVPRRTALADLLRGLAGEGALPEGSTGDGWWRRDVRLQFLPVFRTVDSSEPRRAWQAEAPKAPPILITGASGTLGKALARACEWRGLGYVLTDRASLDLADARSINAALERYEPWAVINAAGWVRVDDAEAREADCLDVNAAGCARLAQACARMGVRFAGFSSDLVFDGRKGSPYVETDAPSPLNVYGLSKARAEDAVLAAGGLMVRTAAFFSPYDLHNFAVHVAHRLARSQPVMAAHDLIISPTYVPDLVDATLDLVIDGEAGIWHLANSGEVSWAQFATKIAGALRLEANLVVPVDAEELRYPARRPARVGLSSERGVLMPGIDNAISRFAAMMVASDFQAEVQARIDRESAPRPEPARP